MVKSTLWQINCVKPHKKEAKVAIYRFNQSPCCIFFKQLYYAYFPTSQLWRPRSRLPSLKNNGALNNKGVTHEARYYFGRCSGVLFVCMHHTRL